MTYSIPEELLKDIVGYLMSRPYSEVAVGVQKLTALMSAQNALPVPVGQARSASLSIAPTPATE